MGVGYRCSGPPYDSIPVAPNPNPKKFKILEFYTKGTEWLVVEVQYEGCTNYEGRKLLLYQNVTLQQLVKQGSIDPHFSDDKTLYYPCARFEPTKKRLGHGT